MDRQTKLNSGDYAGYEKGSDLDAVNGVEFVYDGIVEQISEKFMDKKTGKPQVFYNILGRKDCKKNAITGNWENGDEFSITVSSKATARMLRENAEILLGHLVKMTGQGESVKRKYEIEILD